MRTLEKYSPPQEEKDWDLVALHLGDADKARKEAQALFRSRHAEIGLSYQPLLYALIRLWPEEAVTVVETGVRTGISTFYALSALRHRGTDSTLYSCDPAYLHPTQAKERIQEAQGSSFAPDELFEAWVFLGQKSADALPRIRREAPTWDIFVHDSDHREANMAFELSLAWEALRPGGLLVVDDFHGPGHVPSDPTRHDAFHEFVKERSVPWGTIGGAALVRKPE